MTRDAERHELWADEERFDDEDDEEEEEEDDLDAKYLTFRLGGEVYGLGLRHVLGIEPYQPGRPVPGVPAYVRGIAALRGRQGPVVDLRRRFGLDDAPAAQRRCVVIAEAGAVRLGLLVDEVSEVVHLPAGTVDPPPPFQEPRDGFLAGLARQEDGLLVLLSMDELIAPDDRERLAGASGDDAGPGPATGEEPRAREVRWAAS